MGNGRHLVQYTDKELLIELATRAQDRELNGRSVDEKIREAMK